MFSAVSSPSNFCFFRFQSPKFLRNRCNCPKVFSHFGTSRVASEIDEDDVLQAFLEERELSGDFVAKICDRIWLKRPRINSNDNLENGFVADAVSSTSQSLQEEEDESGGFLKLKRTNEWVLGDIASAPANKKTLNREVRNDSEKRRILNLLHYKALKRELCTLTIGIGTMCSGYCLAVFSVQAALSYAVGVFFSCLYLQLLWQYVDNLSKEAVPLIFTQKRQKKIGIRSEDLEDIFEKTIKGAGLALSSPRLAIPAAVYAIWEVAQHFGNGLFDFQLVPAMVGIFAYKAAALVQVYRDNEDLHFIFPDSEERSAG